MTHKFTIGQAVDLEPAVLRPAAAGRYEIRRLVPAADNDPENPCYCVKHIDEKHERIVRESDISLSRQADTVFS